MKRRNLPLFFGLIIVGAIILITIFADKLATQNPYTIFIGEFQEINGKLSFVKAPFAPNSKYLFGSDFIGRDIFSRILYGARTTLNIALIATIFRFIISIPFGISAGYGNKATSNIIRYFSTAFSAIPALIVSIFILDLKFIKDLDLKESIIAFAIVLTFVEWARLARSIKLNTEEILSMNFIKGEVAVGKNRFQITTQNLWPHLIPQIIIHFFLEMSRSLVLIAQLGVFGRYVGKNKMSIELIQDLQLGIFPEYYPEWGGMLGASRYAIGSHKPWIVLFTAMAFFITVFGFNLLGEGLKLEINKRTSMFITYVKRFMFHISPRTYIYEIKNYSKNRKSANLKTAIIALVLVIILIPSSSSILEINSTETFNHVEELSKDKYEGRLVGTIGNKNAGDYILSNLEKSNIEPLFGDSFTQEFKIKDKLAEIKSANLFIEKDNKKLENFNYREDFTFYKDILSKEKLSGEIISYEEYDKGNFDNDKKYFILVGETIDSLDTAAYIAANSRFMMKVAAPENVIGVIYLDKDFASTDYKTLFNLEPYEDYLKRGEKHFFDPFTIFVKSETYQEIAKNEGSNITLETKLNINNERKGFNIGGIIKGSKNNKESIVIVTNYDYLGYEEDMKYKGLVYNASSIASSLEIADKLGNYDKKPDRDIIFLFLDSSKYKATGGKMLLAYYPKLFNENTFAFYNNYLGIEESKLLYIDISKLSYYNEDHYNYIKYMMSRSKELGIDVQNEMLFGSEEDNYQFIRDTRSTILLFKSMNNANLGEYLNRKQADIYSLDKEKLKIQAQLIIDTITHIAY